MDGSLWRGQRKVIENFSLPLARGVVHAEQATLALSKIPNLFSVSLLWSTIPRTTIDLSRTTEASPLPSSSSDNNFPR